MDKFEGRMSAEIRKQEEIEERWKSLEEVSYWRSIQQRYCLDRMMGSLRMNI